MYKRSFNFFQRCSLVSSLLVCHPKVVVSSITAVSAVLLGDACHEAGGGGGAAGGRV